MARTSRLRLMTSKGFASRAARDLLDLLGETDEELQIFCIHDADASGTMIFQALQEGTAARRGRNVKIINLGLEPEEARLMGLQVEEVKRESKKKQPVADYVDEDEAEWLQDHRVELNAMSSPQLLEWLDSKMAPYGDKLVPPADVLAESLEDDVRSALAQQITEEAIREARVAERVEAELGKRRSSIQAVVETLPETIRKMLQANPSHHWTGPISDLAKSIVGYGLAGPNAAV